MARLYWTKGLGGGFRVSQSIARTGRRRGGSRRAQPVRQAFHGTRKSGGLVYSCPHNHKRPDTAASCKGPFINDQCGLRYRWS